jgi:hypothetical protein
MQRWKLKKHKPWFDQACSKLVDQRKQAKLQLLQDSSEINGGNATGGGSLHVQCYCVKIKVINVSVTPDTQDFTSSHDTPQYH